MSKKHDLSGSGKLKILKDYDDLPKLTQRDAANRLNISQAVLCWLLKYRSNIENAAIQNENLNRKRKGGGKDDDVELASKEWFSKVKAKDARVIGTFTLSEGFVLKNG